MVDIDWDDLPPSTMPLGLSLVVKGFANGEAARQLGKIVIECIHTIGSFIDLATLDGVTVAIDYDAALAEIDRGMDGLRPLSRSNTTAMQGVAMSPAVMREGEVRTHLVFNAENLVPLIAEGLPEADRALAIGIIAHECAHVQITAQKERAIPDARFGTAIEDFERAIMFQLAEICWDEYAACRLSAPFAPGQNATHSATLVAVVTDAVERANEAIRSYRQHGDLDLLVGEAGHELCNPVKVSAYLLGGMDAIGAEWEDLPDVRTAIDEGGYAVLIDQLRAILRDLWNTQESWTPTLDTFAPLVGLTKQVFAAGGIDFTTRSDGTCWIDVPFTAHTMPPVDNGNAS